MNSANNDILPNAGQGKTPVGGKSTLIRRIRRRMRRGRVDVALEDIAVIEASGQFDRQWYLQRNPDVAGSGMDPIQHYVRHGAAEGRDPNESFSTTFYLRNNHDVAATGVNPFRHYLEHGLKEARRGQPVASRHSGARQSDQTTGQAEPNETEATRKRTSDAQTLARSGVFDNAYYLAACPKVAVSGMDPIEHYLKFGAAEGRNPCALFDTSYYVKSNPDVATSGMNPLVHFCRYGFRELRDPSPGFAIAWYWLVHLHADPNVNPLAHYLTQGLRDGLEIRSIKGLSEQDKEQMATACLRLLAREEMLDCAVYRALGRALTALSRWPDAEAAFSRALAMQWDDAKAHANLAAIFARQGKWWQAVESWSVATNLDSSRASWFFRLGEAQEKMNRFALAAEAYQRGLELEPDRPQWYYRLGYVHEKAGQQNLADAAYAEAVGRDPNSDVKACGIGVFHQARGYWPEACEAYARELEAKPLSAELHFKLGMAHDRCYRWQEAEAAYREAIAIKLDTPYWHYRLGFVLERQQRFSEAADAYATAATLNPKPMPYWWYRCGYVLAEAGRYEEACLTYIKTREAQTIWGETYTPAGPGQAAGGRMPRLEDYLDGLSGKKLITDAVVRDSTDAKCHYQLGAVRERWGDWLGASKAYADAVARSNPHRPDWYYRLGFVLFLSARFREACEAFRETRILRRPFGIAWSRYQKSAEQRMLMEYNEYLETLPIRDKHVLYESMLGTSAGGNPLAIFECMSADPRYAGWTHIWVLASRARVPSDLATRSDVVFVERGSDLYRRYLATASHLVNDVTFPYWFIRRAGQKYLNTWHGTPLKKLGKDIPGEFMAHSNIQRNLFHATHLISPNSHTSDVLMNSYDVGGVLTAKLAEVGYPRIDRLLNVTPERRAEICADLSLAVNKPVVLYAPTWRGEHGHAKFDVERLRRDLLALAKLPCQLVFRGHHMIEEMLEQLDLPVVVASQEIDTSDVLAITDILITDYSSIFFDFLPLNRPVLYYAYDEREYAKQRGLYFDIRSLPGIFCENLDTLIAALTQQLERPITDDPDYAEAKERFCPHEDGKAGVRSIAFFFDDDSSHVVSRYIDTRPSLLFFNGLFIPNGITSSFLNLADALAAEAKSQITVAIDPERISREPIWLDKLRKVPAATKFIGRTGRSVRSPEEYWIEERFSRIKDLDTAPMWAVLEESYQREFRRIFGNGKHDSIVNFEGYSGFWTALLGLGARDTHNVTYLHNDMLEEFRTRHPYLRANFGAYRYYDRLVSVSKHMSDVNRRKLGTEFGLQASVFVPCVNSLNVEQIRRRAREPLDKDLVPWMVNGPCFLSVGRMSPEKDHAKLIVAFAQVHAQRPDARLVIMGDGPLRGALRAQIAKSDLQNSVFLAGLRENPFPALAQCDCFVLPSNYEGQPMVLLEAMVLGRPVVATDIDGNRAVLGGDYGYLADNSAAGLQQGMEEFLAGQTATGTFDANAYQERALEMFHKITEAQLESHG